MAASLTTWPSVLAAPHNELQITGMTGATVVVTRIDSRGNRVAVRPGDQAPLVSGAWFGTDYEAPYGPGVTYQAVSNTGDTATATAAALGPRGAWLIHPGIPTLSQKIRPRLPIADKVRPVNRGIHAPLGRTYPIAITDGVRQAPTFDLVLKTKTDIELQGILNLLADASVLLLQQGWKTNGRSDYLWVSVGDLTETAPVGVYEVATRYWTLPCQVTTAPIGTLQSPFSYTSVSTGYASYNAVSAAFATYADLLRNTPS